MQGRWRARTAGVLACVGPAVVLAAGIGWLLSAEQAAPGLSVTAIEKELGRGEPEIVVVGNSMAGQGVDEAALGRLLGGRVAVLNVPSSTAPHWYIVLKERVFGAGHRPRLVVVAVTMERLLTLEAPDGLPATFLEEHGGGDDPVLQDKIFRRGALEARWARLRLRGEQKRDALLTGVRNLVAALVLDVEPEHSDERAAELLGEVFGLDATEAEARRVMPVQQVQAPRSDGGEADEMPPPGSSLVPDIVALAQAHDTPIVFVQFPVRSPVRERERGSPQTHAALIELLNAEGAGFIDLMDLELSARDFSDPVHLSPPGRARFTAALGAALLEIGAMEGAIQPARLPLVVDLTRAGEPPALPAPDFAPVGEGMCGYKGALDPSLAPLEDASLAALGWGPISPLVILEAGTPLAGFASASVARAAECLGQASFPGKVALFSPREPGATGHTLALSPDFPLRADWGEVWWVYPGTTAQIRLANRQAGDDTLRLAVREVQPGSQPATLHIGGAPGVGLAGPRAEAEVPLGGAEQAEIRSPSGGPWLLIESLSVGAVEVVAPPEPPVLDLLLSTRRDALRFAADPAPLGAGEPEAAGGIGSWSLPALQAVADDVLFDRHGIHSCSPVRVLEDGEALPGVHSSCDWVLPGRKGKVCHAGQEVRFLSSDGSDPGQNGRRYEVVLHAARRCKHRLWVYPGDRLIGARSRNIRSALDRVPRELAVRGQILGAGSVRLRLYFDDQLLLEQDIAPQGELILPLGDPRLATGLRARLELESPPGGPFLLLDAVELR